MDCDEIPSRRVDLTEEALGQMLEKSRKNAGDRIFKYQLVAALVAGVAVGAFSTHIDPLESAWITATVMLCVAFFCSVAS